MTRAGTAAILLLTLAAGQALAATDITARVKAESPAASLVERTCQDYCQGNEREGRLDRVLAERRGPNEFWTRGEASFRNRHRQALRNGEPMTLYDFTVKVIAIGTLDTRECLLRLDDAWIENDRVGLDNLAKREIGKTYRIENCRRFVRGL